MTVHARPKVPLEDEAPVDGDRLNPDPGVDRLPITPVPGQSERYWVIDCGPVGGQYTLRAYRLYSSESIAHQEILIAAEESRILYADRPGRYVSGAGWVVSPRR